MYVLAESGGGSAGETESGGKVEGRGRCRGVGLTLFFCFSLPSSFFPLLLLSPLSLRPVQTRRQLQKLGVVATFVQLLEHSKIIFVQRSAAFALAACALDRMYTLIPYLLTSSHLILFLFLFFIYIIFSDESGQTLVKIGLNALHVGLAGGTGGGTGDPTVVSLSALTLSRLAHHSILSSPLFSSLPSPPLTSPPALSSAPFYISYYIISFFNALFQRAKRVLGRKKQKSFWP